MKLTGLVTSLLSATGLKATDMDPALAPAADSLYEFAMTNIDGKEQSLSAYKGKTVIIVNTASKCGLTPQYAGLEAMYRKYKDKGLVILGFPANDFMGQEPGSDNEIKEFCSVKYDVTFPMFSKITVIGEETHPLYRWLIAKSGKKEQIEWNFAKFIVSPDGRTVTRFSPKTKPDDKDFVKAVEATLKP